MWEYIKTCWKQLSIVVGVLAIITSLFAWDARYAKTAQIEKIDIKVEDTAQRVKAIDVKQNVMRLNSITEQLVKYRILIKTYPNDKELKEDYEVLKQEKVKVQKDLDKSMK
jgi:hypothetical protein